MPIQVDEVVAFFEAREIKDEIYFWLVESDVEILRGKMKHWEYPDENGKIVSCIDVDISRNLDERWQRLVSCKEILHLLDPKNVQVHDEITYNRLIEKVILPANLQDPFTDGREVNSDRVAELQAAAILFPYKTRELLYGPYHRDKTVTIEDIVRIVDLPPRYVAYVMSDVWEGIHSMLSGKNPFYKVSVSRFDAAGKLAERQVLAGRMQTRAAALASAEALAAKYQRHEYDDVNERWLVTDRNEILWFMSIDQ